MQGATVKQDKAGSDSLGTRAVSQTATSDSCDQTMVFGRGPGLQSNGVDAEIVFVDEAAGVI